MIITSTHAPLCPRWSGCVITAASSRRSWPSQASGLLVRLGDPLASVQPSASHLCAKRPVTRSSGPAPKHPQAPPPQSKTLTDPAHPGPHLEPMLGHVANHHETRKLKQFWYRSLVTNMPHLNLLLSQQNKANIIENLFMPVASRFVVLVTSMGQAAKKHETLQIPQCNLVV